MAKLTCLIPGGEIEDLKEDLRAAKRIEQYRLGEKALFFPRGLSWEYLPRESILRAERSRRVISAGHCVTVREEKPAVDLVTETGSFTLNLEKPASAALVLEKLAKSGEGGA